MNRDSNRNTGLKIPPPLYYATAILIGLALQYFFPIRLLSEFWKYTLGITLIVVSLIIIVFVIIRYKKSKTPFDVSKSANTLISDGPNRFSRNPGYLSLTLLYIGIGIILNNIWVLSLSIPVLLVINLFIIRKEEIHLESLFGEEYLNYKSSVPRWI